MFCVGAWFPEAGPPSSPEEFLPSEHTGEHGAGAKHRKRLLSTLPGQARQMGRTHADQRDATHALHDLHSLQGQPSPGIVSGLLSNRRRFPSPTKHNLPDEDTARIQMVGIGILLDTERMDGQLPVIRSVEPAGGAALSQRVTEGDRIETINGVEVRYVETETIARILMGPRGSDVTVRAPLEPAQPNELRAHLSVSCAAPARPPIGTHSVFQRCAEFCARSSVRNRARRHRTPPRAAPD